MDNNNYKRQYRQLNDTTKKKISQSLRGRTKSATHTQAISNGLKKYWATVPNQPNNEHKNEEQEENIRFKYRCVEALLRSDSTQQYQCHKRQRDWRKN